MKKYIASVIFFLFSPFAISSPPIYGPLMVQNNLDEITQNGTQSTAQVNLFGYTISLTGNFSTSGGNSLTFTTIGTTNVTLPTSGTLLTTSGAAGIYAPIASPTFTGTVIIPSGSVINTPTSINLTNATALPYTALPSLSDNQILGSLTATTPSGLSVTSCSTSSSGLQWTSGSGFGCNTSINAATLLAGTWSTPGTIGSGTANSGSFTTLSASSTVSGLGFSTYLSSPPSIGGTVAASGSFTTLNASGNDALLYQNTGGQTLTNNTVTTITGWTKVFDRVNSNFNASTGTFTAPTTGYYQVSGQLSFSAVTASSVNETFQIRAVANGTPVAIGQTPSQTTSSINYSVVLPETTVLLSSGQTIIIQGFQNSGSSLALATGSGENIVSINRIP